MTCNPENKKIRQIWVAGTLPNPIKLLELNESDDYEVYPTYSEDGILLIAIKHGRKERLVKELPVFDQQGRPLYEWCKITLFAISENEERLQIKQVILSARDSFPERDDWRAWIYSWEQKPITDAPLSKNPCTNKYSRDNFVTLIEDNLFRVDITQSINNASFDKILGLGYSENYVAEINLNFSSLTEEKSDCTVSEPEKIPIEINGFNFSPEQQKQAKIIAAAGWVKPR